MTPGMDIYISADCDSEVMADALAAHLVADGVPRERVAQRVRLPIVVSVHCDNAEVAEYAAAFASFGVSA